MAFVRDTDGGNALFVISLDSGVIRRLIGAREVGREVASPRWSPDGRMIVFAGGDCTRARSRLYTINADGTGLSALPAIPASLKALHDYLWIDPEGWSPDGTRLLYEISAWTDSCGLDSSFVSDHLYAISTAGTDRTRLLDTTKSYLGEATWSPDGREIAVATGPFYQPGGNALYTCDVRLVERGAGVRPLARFRFRGGCGSGPGFAWDPSGNSLIVGAPSSIDRIDLHTGQVAKVGRALAFDCCWVSSDGQLIAFHVAGGNDAIDAITAAGQFVARLLPPRGTSIVSLDVHLG